MLLAHICWAARHNLGCPKFVPIDVRPMYDRRILWPLKEAPPGPMFQCMEEYTQAINVATFLEMLVAHGTNGLKNAEATLHELMRNIGTFEGFTFLNMADMSLLLATIVSQTLVCYKDRSLLTFSESVVRLVTGILTLHENVTVHLFKAVIAKLKGLEVPMCLALWLESIDTHNVLDLFEGLQDYYLSASKSYPTITPENVVAGMAIKLMCLHQLESPAFLGSLYQFLEEALGYDKWEALWRMLDEQEVYNS